MCGGDLYARLHGFHAPDSSEKQTLSPLSPARGTRGLETWRSLSKAAQLVNASDRLEPRPVCFQTLDTVTPKGSSVVYLEGAPKRHLRGMWRRGRERRRNRAVLLSQWPFWTTGTQSPGHSGTQFRTRISALFHLGHERGLLLGTPVPGYFRAAAHVHTVSLGGRQKGLRQRDAIAGGWRSGQDWCWRIRLDTDMCTPSVCLDLREGFPVNFYLLDQLLL